MRKNCFEGYLTDACRTCKFWYNDEHCIGCGAPFPIGHCPDFVEMENSNNNKQEANHETET